MVHNCVKNLFTPTLDKEPIEKVLRKKIPYEPLQFIRDSVRLKYVIIIIIFCCFGKLEASFTIVSFVDFK